MVYAPQRRHAVASVGGNRALANMKLSTTFQALAILQHLYAPSFWVLLGRLLAQLRMNESEIVLTA